MNNIILLINFNFSEHLVNKDFLQQLYSPHFKKIVFYSDLSDGGNKYNDVHYVDTDEGWYAQGIFVHFYENYKQLIEESDGVYYTHDDCLINVNTLKDLDKNKLIFTRNLPKDSIKSTEYCLSKNKRGELVWPSWRHETLPCHEIQHLLENPHLKEQVKWFTHAMSDLFYLPKKHWDDGMINFLKCSYDAKLFLEIAIPTMLLNYITEQLNDQAIWQFPNKKILWRDDREFNKDQLKQWLVYDECHVVHPIKITQYPWQEETLREIFLQ